MKIFLRKIQKNPRPSFVHLVRVSKFKRFILILSSALIFAFYIFWMWKFCRNHVKKFKISTYRRNLMTLAEQTKLELSLCLYIILDQILNIFLEIYSTHLSPATVFKIWWISHLWEKMIFICLKNIWIYSSASQEYPEFNGYQGKVFPGEKNPRPISQGVNPIF